MSYNLGKIKKCKQKLKLIYKLPRDAFKNLNLYTNKNQVMLSWVSDKLDQNLRIAHAGQKSKTTLTYLMMKITHMQQDKKEVLSYDQT